MDTKNVTDEYILHTYGRFPVTLVKGKGSIAFDENNKRYIDLTSGIGVNAFGFCDETFIEAVTQQAKKLQHTSNLFYTEPAAYLSKLLSEKSGMSKVFFSNSGAEANECAIKAARRFSLQKNGKGFHNIVTLKNSFHGRTITTLAATGQESFHEDFFPFTDGFLYADTDNTESIKTIVKNNKCAAIMIEIIQGEGGVMPLSYELIETIKELSTSFDIPLIIDEVQTGNGRTGKYFSYMHYNLNPDIVTTAKGLGGGLPIGATLFSKRFENALISGTHGSTFGGNPIVCAGASSIVERIDDAMLSDITAKGEYISSAIKDFSKVKSVSGKGLMLGIEIEGEVKSAVSRCIENGVLVLTAKNKVRLLPALSISYKEIDEALSILKSCI